MPRNLSPSQKTAFLKKRIADTEKHKNDALAFMEKNKELHQKKLSLRNQLIQQRKIMGALQLSEEEKSLTMIFQLTTPVFSGRCNVTTG